MTTRASGKAGGPRWLSDLQVKLGGQAASQSFQPKLLSSLLEAAVEP
jgi:hypothetical protein